MAVPNAGIEPKSTRFRGRFEERARFPGEVAPLIIICRSDCRDRIVHSINHDTASRDKAGEEAESSCEFSMKFIRQGNLKPPFGCRRFSHKGSEFICILLICFKRGQLLVCSTRKVWFFNFCYLLWSSRHWFFYYLFPF